MIKVRIPATSANLGSGFDSLGLAVTLYNYVFMEEAEGCRITAIDGADIPTDETNLVYTAAKHLYALCGRPFPGLHILQENNIPLARGLGSSSACIVGGLIGANALLGEPVGRDEIIHIAAAIEGHPDNVTPAILGGLVTAALESGKVYYVKQEIAADLCFVTFVPDFELQTSAARAALPKEVSHRDAVFNLSRAALMSMSLSSGKYENLRVGADDRLQQPYRLSLIPGGEQAVSMAYGLGAYASYISGAGSTIMAIVDAKDESFVVRARKALDDLGLRAWACTEYSIDNAGVQIF